MEKLAHGTWFTDFFIDLGRSKEFDSSMHLGWQILADRWQDGETKSVQRVPMVSAREGEVTFKKYM